MKDFTGLEFLDANTSVQPFGYEDDEVVTMRFDTIWGRLRAISRVVQSPVMFFGFLPYGLSIPDSKGFQFTASIRRMTNEIHRQFHLNSSKLLKDNILFFQVAMIEPFCSDPAFFTLGGRPKDVYLRAVNSLMSSVSKGVLLKEIDLSVYKFSEGMS